MHAILQYEAKDIIVQRERQYTASPRQFLEYGLLESVVWDKIVSSHSVAMLNPSMSSIKRIKEKRGEIPVILTNMEHDDAYLQEINKVMKSCGYVGKAQIVNEDRLDSDVLYYVGFSGGEDVRSRLVHMFGFELNPYHPSALENVIVGVTMIEGGVEIAYPSTSHYNTEKYWTNPNYYRYTGDVFVKDIVSRRVEGDEMYNLIVSHKVNHFSPALSVLNDGDVLSGASFYRSPIATEEEIDGLKVYKDEDGKVIDSVAPESHESRRYDLQQKGYELAEETDNKFAASVVALRYRNQLFNISLDLRKKDPEDDCSRYKVKRYTVKYGVKGTTTFRETPKYQATHVYMYPNRKEVKLSDRRFGNRPLPRMSYMLKDGDCMTQDGEYVRLLSKSAIVCTRAESGVRGKVKTGRSLGDFVAYRKGVWESLVMVDLHVDFMYQFDLVDVFQSYRVRNPTSAKRSSILEHFKGRGNMGVIREEYAFYPGAGHLPYVEHPLQEIL